MLYTSLLYNTTPIHCTPLPLHPPVMNTQLGPMQWGRRCGMRSAFCARREQYTQPVSAKTLLLIRRCVGIGLQSTNSGGWEQFLLLDWRATAHVNWVFFHRHQSHAILRHTMSYHHAITCHTMPRSFFVFSFWGPAFGLTLQLVWLKTNSRTCSIYFVKFVKFWELWIYESWPWTMIN